MARVPQMTRRDAQSRSAPTTTVDRSAAFSAAGQAFGQVKRSLMALDAQNTAERNQARNEAEAQQKAAQVRAASREGQAAGFNMPSLNLRPDDSDENIAFNAAATRSYTRALEVEMRDRFRGIAETHAHNPAAMQEKIDGYVTGFQSRVPEHLKGEVGLLANDLASPFLAQANKAQRAQIVAQDKADFQTHMSRRLEDYTRTAYLSDMDPDGDARVGRAANGVKNLLVQYGPKTAFTFDGVEYPPDPARAGVLGVDGIAQAWTDAERDARLTRIEGGFLRLDNEQEQAAYAEQVDAEFKSGSGLGGRLLPEDHERLQAEFSRTLKQHETRRKQTSAEAKSQIRDLNSVVLAGFEPDPGAIEQVSVLAYSSGDPEAIQMLDGYKRTQSFMAGLKAASPAEIRAFVSEQRAQPQSAQSAERVKIAENYLGKVEAGLKKDPLGWAARAGYTITPLEPGEDMAVQLQTRAQEARAIAVEYDLSQPVYLTPDEQRLFSDYAAQGGAEMEQVVRMLSEGGEVGRAMLQEIAPKAPELAHIAGLASVGGDALFISDASAGVSMTQDPAYKSRRPTKTDMAPRLRDVYGQAFAHMPEAQMSAEAAALNAYEARAFKAGIAPGNAIDRDMLDRALQQAAGAIYSGRHRYGGTTNYQKYDIVVPSWIRHDKFDDVIKSLDDTRWEDAGAYGPPVDADGRRLSAQDLRSAKLVSISNGRYRVSLNNPDSAVPLYAGAADSPDGYYVLDLNQIEGALRSDTARASWFYGGGE